MDTAASQTAARVEQSQERELHLQHLRQEHTVEKVFAESGVRFKVPNNEVLAALGTVRFDMDGVPVVAGVPLADALQNYAKVNSHAVASSIAESHDKGKSSVRSKSELLTIKDRVSFINEWGEAAYSRLPAVPPQPLDVDKLTFNDWRKLPISTRSKIISERGPDFVHQLRAADAELERYNRLIGVPTGQRRA